MFCAECPPNYFAAFLRTICVYTARRPFRLLLGSGPYRPKTWDMQSSRGCVERVSSAAASGWERVNPSTVVWKLLIHWNLQQPAFCFRDRSHLLVFRIFFVHVVKIVTPSPERVHCSFKSNATAGWTCAAIYDTTVLFVADRVSSFFSVFVRFSVFIPSMIFVLLSPPSHSGT